MRDPEAPAPVTRLAHDARIVAAAREYEGDVSVAHEIDLVDRAPRRDMVRFRGHRRYWRANVAQHDRSTLHLVPPFEQVVVEEEAAQILAMHAARHAGGVGVPGHKIAVDLERALAHQVLMH